ILAAPSAGNGTGLAVTGFSVVVAGLTVQGFANGVTANAPATVLNLTDVKFTGNTSGGTLTGVQSVTFTGNATAETLTASGTQCGRVGDNLLTDTGGTSLVLNAADGNDLLVAGFPTAGSPAVVVLDGGTGSNALQFAGSPAADILQLSPTFAVLNG